MAVAFYRDQGFRLVSSGDQGTTASASAVVATPMQAVANGEQPLYHFMLKPLKGAASVQGRQLQSHGSATNKRTQTAAKRKSKGFGARACLVHFAHSDKALSQRMVSVSRFAVCTHPSQPAGRHTVHVRRNHLASRPTCFQSHYQQTSLLTHR